MNKIVFVRSSLNDGACKLTNFHKFQVEVLRAEEIYLIKYIKPDLVAIDSPVYRNLHICRKLRERGLEVPIIGFSCGDSTETKVCALKNGMDDIIDKNISQAELEAKILSILRRPKMFFKTVLNISGFEIDLTNRTVRNSESTIELRKKEFDLLALLAENKGKPLSRDEILENLWEEETEPLENTIDVHIRYLRRKIDPKNKQGLIKTIRGVGYKIDE